MPTFCAVAHLGGKAGMKQFVRSGEEYNPEDEFDSSLGEYYENRKNFTTT